MKKFQVDIDDIVGKKIKDLENKVKQGELKIKNERMKFQTLYNKLNEIKTFYEGDRKEIEIRANNLIEYLVDKKILVGGFEINSEDVWPSDIT